MSNFSDDGRARRPVTEPEIIPPDRAGPQRQTPEPMWVRQRVFVARPGPMGIAMGLVALAALVGIGFVALLGFVVLALPLVGAMVAAFILAAMLRGPRRRL
jgi:hypothetical protein